ncbi:MAG: alanine--glyoxylate aminotransferase family protein [Elusimicrobia bacterium]|nr:alanine--glyoxylate aminotransferase family protein [Elusimicrobiota bacterium]MDE2237597.1 alanine--glyoxylate aminotransferase family protein [Elusimicrobiota bacterium]MDE2424791.1 alanine--glyoxylate aminotransferase family protein [Elusimicrobiota bacterium]
MKRYILLTPGPTPLPPSVSQAMAQPILHHRTKEFGALFEYTLEQMKYVFRTQASTVLMCTTSGTGMMESAVANLLSPGDKALVHATGAFGDRFVKILRSYGLSPVVVSETWGHAADPEKLRRALKDNPGLKAVFFQHTDTSTGVLNALEPLARAVRELQPEALVVVDAVSGLAAERLETDAWGLDVVLTGSQKGLMGAPGLGFAAVGQRAWARVEEAKLPRFYFDWRSMRKSLDKKETPYTPAVTLVAGQAEALKLIRAEGIENVWARTSRLAGYTRAWAAKVGLQLFARDPAAILTALKLPEGVDGDALIKDILREEGISIAGGQLQLKGKIIRIAHMGFISQADLDAGFAALEKRLAPSGAVRSA